MTEPASFEQAQEILSLFSNGINKEQVQNILDNNDLFEMMVDADLNNVNRRTFMGAIAPTEIPEADPTWQSEVAHLPLRGMTYLALLDTEGSYTRAARRVELSVPTVWRQIQNLEDTFGLRLIEPSSKRAEEVHLTPEGKILVKYTRVIMSVGAALISAAKKLKEEPQSEE